MPLEGKANAMADEATATATAQTTEQNATDNLVARIASINVYKGEKGTTIYIRTNTKVKTMEQGEDMLYHEVEKAELSMPAVVLLTLLKDDENVCFYLNSKDDQVDEKMLNKLLTFSKVVFTNVKHLKGEVIDGVALDRDKWFKEFLRIELSDKMKKAVAKYVDKMLDEDI